MRDFLNLVYNISLYLRVLRLDKKIKQNGL